MKKEEFMALGIDAKLAEKAEEESKKELAGYIPKARFDEVNDAKKKLEADVKDRDTQLEELKKTAGDNADLQKQISDLQEANRKKDEEHKREVDNMKMDSAIKAAIAGIAHDADLVAGLFDRTKLILGDDGKVTGLDEQLKTLKESKKFLFKEEKPDSNQQQQQRMRFGGAPEQDNGGDQGKGGFTLRDAISEAIGSSK